VTTSSTSSTPTIPAASSVETRAANATPSKSS
jgi:hypothetical protein